MKENLFICKIMKNHINSIFFAVLFIFNSDYTLCQTIKTGIYNWGTMCIVADNSTGKITGYYENYSGLDEQAQQFSFSCIFLFSGNMSNGQKKFPILSYAYDGSDTISGEIIIESDTKIRIYLQREHGKCSQVEKFSEKISPIFQITEEKNWKGIAAVKTEKAFFHTAPDEARKSSRVVSKGSFVKILEEKDTWLKVEFQSGDSIINAWLKKSDLF